MRFAIVGGGVIGGGWAARMLLHGHDVKVHDPDPAVARKLEEILDNARPAYRRLGLGGGPEGGLEICDDLATAVGAADFVQENAPENETLKKRLLAEITAYAPADSLVASSTSGLLPSRLQADCRHPERVFVGHPFNPVYLLPLVELCGGDRTAPESLDRAAEIYQDLGLRPLRVRHEIDGFIADRLMEALWREALHLVNDGIATTAEIDDAIRYGAGLRWAFMGPFMTFWLAGGEGGMRHFMSQFGPALKLPWTKLAAPELTDQLLDRIVAQSEAQCAGHDIRALERLRDDCLIEIMQGLARHDFAAGEVLNRNSADGG